MENTIKDSDVNYLIKMNLVEKIPNNIVNSKDRNKIGEAHSFKLTPLGLKYFNEITLRKINTWLLFLTIILVIFGFISFFI